MTIFCSPMKIIRTTIITLALGFCAMALYSIWGQHEMRTAVHHARASR
jgi:hypothetical protein